MPEQTEKRAVGATKSQSATHLTTRQEWILDKFSGLYEHCVTHGIFIGWKNGIDSNEVFQEAR